MKLTRTTLVLTVAVLMLPMVAVGKDEYVSAEVNSDNEVFENMQVASQKSPGELRRDLWRAEKKFYALYNKLNNDNLYDVRCTIEVPTGSVIKSQVCRPKFLDRALRDGKIKNPSSLESNPEIAGEIVTFREKLETLVAADPELQTAAAAFNLAHAQLEAGNETSVRN